MKRLGAPLGRSELLFVVFLSASQFYYGYRYALQYSSESTSPTYQDTPLLFQAGKYLLAAAIFAVSLAFLALHRRAQAHATHSANLFLVLLFGFFGYATVIDLVMIGSDAAELPDAMFVRAFFFLPLLALLPFHYRGWESLKAYTRIVVVFGMAYHIVYSAIQIASYLAVGRLPALGHAGSLVRFGGGWDDPNGFGIFLVLPVLMLSSSSFAKPFTRWWGMLVLSALLLLTSSFTAIVGFAGAFVFFCAAMGRWRLVLALVVPVVIALAASEDLRSLIEFVWSAKSGSIESHLEQLSLDQFIASSNLLELLFGRRSTADLRNESFYVALLQNYGIVGLSWLGLLIVATLTNALAKAAVARRAGNERGYASFTVLASFLVGFCIASAGIPEFYVFPVNLYFWLSVLVVWLTPAIEQPGLAPAGAAAAPLKA